MKSSRRQTGFTLIAAIFLLVGVAALVVYITNIRVVQQTTLVYGAQGARAMQAAHSGIQWGIYKALNGAACPATTTFIQDQPALKDFSITVSCVGSTHMEATTSITAYQLTATASSGSYGSLDYVQRGIQATVSLDPP